MTEISIGEKENAQIKGLICNMWLFSVIQYYLSLSNTVPKFRILTQVVVKKSLTEKNVHMCFIRVTEGKIEDLKKEGKMRIITSTFF